MANKAFVLQRITNFAGREFDPNSDPQVKTVLQNRFNILLPQRRSMNESLAASASTHEIITLIQQYRSLCVEEVNAAVR